MKHSRAIFEFTAVPQLLSLLPPPSSRSQLFTDPSFLQTIGASNTSIFIVRNSCISLDFSISGFLRPSLLSSQFEPFPTVKSSCRIESFGPFGAGSRVSFPFSSQLSHTRHLLFFVTGTLFAGDGVVIQQRSQVQGPSCGSCNALLRYPRSSFGAGNITL